MLKNPFEGFRPSPGKVTFSINLLGEWAFIESALYTGYQIPPFYDLDVNEVGLHMVRHVKKPILRMKRMSFELVVEGADTNQEFVEDLLDSSAFKRGDYTTAYVESEFWKH